MPNKHLPDQDDKLVPGHLRERKLKGGVYYYLVINLKQEDGNGVTVRKPKWIPTGLPVKGNLKRAEKMLQEARLEYTEKERQQEAAGDPSRVLFSDFMGNWLKTTKRDLRITTYSSYLGCFNATIGPYFKSLDITLDELTAKHIQDFYDYLRNEKNLSERTVHHYHCLLHKTLAFAVKDAARQGKQMVNPMVLVDSPKVNNEVFVGDRYSQAEATQLLEAIKGTQIEIPVLMGILYGLRRSEVCGLRWDAFDFDRDVFLIYHTVKQYAMDGRQIVFEDLTKNSSSRRTLPLQPSIKKKLLEHKERQQDNKRLCGNMYNQKYMDYVNINEIGNFVNPDSLSKAFKTTLKKSGLREIRFHDLRHTCASLLLDNKVPLIDVSRYIGHSSVATTGNIYGHLDFTSKVDSAKTMMNLMDDE